MIYPRYILNLMSVLFIFQSHKINSVSFLFFRSVTLIYIFINSKCFLYNVLVFSLVFVTCNKLALCILQGPSGLHRSNRSVLVKPYV